MAVRKGVKVNKRRYGYIHTKDYLIKATYSKWISNLSSIYMYM